MIVMIDNYDSFTYNLVQYLEELGERVRVFRNDAVTPEKVAKLKPDRIVISPGPRRPEEAGVSNEIIRRFAGKTPLLGVCLGHQCIGHVFGGTIVRAKRLMHGKTSPVSHTGRGLYRKIPNPFEATRYHSLVISRKNFPKELVVEATAEDDGEIMGIRHRTLPIYGVQFHPESILTAEGKAVLKNFLNL